jgi:hypothetical protein
MTISSCRFWWIDSSTRVGNLSNKSSFMSSSIGGGLESAVRESNGEGSSNIAVGILGLSLLEVNLRVVISYSILISIRLGSKLLHRFVCWGRGILGSGYGQEGCGGEKLKLIKLLTSLHK